MAAKGLKFALKRRKFAATRLQMQDANSGRCTL